MKAILLVGACLCFTLAAGRAHDCKSNLGALGSLGVAGIMIAIMAVLMG